MIGSVLIGWAFQALGIGLLAAPSSIDAPVVITLDDRAGDAAIQALADVVISQFTPARRRLSTELATVADADRSVREFVAAKATLDPAQEESNGTIVRRARIDPARVTGFLAELASRDPYLLDARRLRLPADTPELVGTGRLRPSHGPFDDHPGWRFCSRTDIALVRNAVVEDLRTNLLVELADLRGTAGGRLGELLTQNPNARGALRKALGGVALPDPVLEPYGVCRIRLVLPRRQVVSLLQSVLGARTANEISTDWPRLVASTPATIAVDGFAVAPPAPRPTTRPAAP